MQSVWRNKSSCCVLDHYVDWMYWSWKNFLSHLLSVSLLVIYFFKYAFSSRCVLPHCRFKLVCFKCQKFIKQLILLLFCRGHPVVLQNWKTTVNLFFRSNITIFYYLTYWPQILVIGPSSGHLYIKFKTGVVSHMTLNLMCTTCTLF